MIRNRARYALLLCVPLICSLAGFGCGKREKTTPELIADLKSGEEKDRIVAARLLQHKGDPTKTLPALIGALKDKDADVRRGAAIGLGYLGDGAKEAIPALQAALKDRDVRVREAAGVALFRIVPSRFTDPTRQPHEGKGV